MEVPTLEIRKILRRKTKEVSVGKVLIGGNNPISVQSMTTTKTSDLKATLNQIKKLVEAGCEIVRVAVPDEASVENIPKIKEKISIPLVADIHFDYRLALKSIEAGVDKIRINPGTIGGLTKVKEILKKAKKRGIPIRVGLNTGSLPKKFQRTKNLAFTLAQGAAEYGAFLEENGFKDIVFSVKSSSPLVTINAYRLLAKKTEHPFHLGITEAGTYLSGTVKSSIGLGVLLEEGIGDTIRVSLTTNPVKEVLVGIEILKALGLKKGADLVSCPTCSRCEIDLIPLAEKVEKKLMKVKLPIKVAVMGCVVNGPGEAKEADIGIAGGKKAGVLFKHGKVVRKVSEDRLLEVLFEEIDLLEKGN